MNDTEERGATQGSGLPRGGPPPPAPPERYRGPFLVDTHVHLHSCFELRRFLDAANSNFELRGLRAASGGLSGVLVLTESAGEDGFDRLWNGTRSDTSGKWSLEPCDDGISVLARAGPIRRILLVAGRQIASRERLEALVIGSRPQVPDGLPFRELLAELTRERRVTAVPWGFGKWWFGREQVFKSGLEAVDPARVFVADSGVRPASHRRPSAMEWAMRRGHGLLLGSDPLNLASQVRRAGSCGNLLEGTISARDPGRDVVALLASGSRVKLQFGERDTWLGFVTGQIGIRLPAARRRS